MTSHGGQKKVLLGVMHEAVAQIKQLIVNACAGWSHVRATALRLDNRQRWFALMVCIVERILASQPKPGPDPGLISLAPGQLRKTD